MAATAGEKIKDRWYNRRDRPEEQILNIFKAVSWCWQSHFSQHRSYHYYALMTRGLLGYHNNLDSIAKTTYEANRNLRALTLRHDEVFRWSSCMRPARQYWFISQCYNFLSRMICVVKNGYRKPHVLPILLTKNNQGEHSLAHSHQRN